MATLKDLFQAMFEDLKCSFTVEDLPLNLLSTKILHLSTNLPSGRTLLCMIMYYRKVCEEDSLKKMFSFIGNIDGMPYVYKGELLLLMNLSTATRSPFLCHLLMSVMDNSSLKIVENLIIC